eukprot:COSAG06_NODE_9709_length_1837_cov_125.360184_3_plen_100_part_00
MKGCIPLLLQRSERRLDRLPSAHMHAARRRRQRLPTTTPTPAVNATPIVNVAAVAAGAELHRAQYGGRPLRLRGGCDETQPRGPTALYYIAVRNNTNSQ